MNNKILAILTQLQTIQSKIEALEVDASINFPDGEENAMYECLTNALGAIHETIEQLNYVLMELP